MSMFRQGSLFDLQELYDLEPTQRFEAVFATIDVPSLVHHVWKKSLYGAPVQLNDAAMIYSLVARKLERIPTIQEI